MRVVILTQYYPPETGAPQRRLSHLARRLRDRGHEVEVVTAMPNYPTGRVFEPWRGRIVGRDEVDGIPVLRSFIFASPHKRVPLQLANYLSFAASSALAGMVGVRRADVVMWESPPLFLGVSAWLMARRTGARLVMNVSDLWVRSAREMGILKDPMLVRFFEAWERLAYAQADLVTCQTEGIRDGVLASRPGTKTFLYPNGVDLSSFRRSPADPALRREFSIPEDAILVGYAGNFGRAQAMGQVVQAASLLRDRNDLYFLLIGDGPCRAEVMEMAARLGAENVRFPGRVASERIPEIESQWDIALVPLADLPVLAGARPSKMFELMAMEVPFVFCGKGEGADLAARSGAARVVPAERPAELAAAVRELASAGPAARRDMGRAGRGFVAREFDRDVIAGQVEAALAALL